MFIVELLVAASQPSSINSKLSDEELCQSLQRMYANVAGAKIGPATMLQSGPECGAKRLNNHLSVALSGAQREDFASRFAAYAKANLCHSTDATLVAFKARRWGWHYEFKFTDGTVIKKQIAC